MPQPKNQLLRLLIPAIVVVVGIGVAFAVLKTASKTQPSPAATAPQSPQTPPPPSTGPGSTAAAPATPPASQAPAATPTAAPAAPITGLHVVPVAVAGAPASVGDLDPKGPYKARIEFAGEGAGIRSLLLTDHFETIRNEQHVETQRLHSVQVVSETDTTGAFLVYVVDDQVASASVNGREFAKSRVRVNGDKVELLADDGSVAKALSLSASPLNVLVPFAALALEVTPAGGQPVIVPLAGTNVWQPSPDKHGHFEAIIADGAGTPILRLTREFALAPNSLDITLSQQVANLSPEALTVRWYEAGPVDLPQDAMSYGGDKRRVRFGYLLPPEKDPARATVLSSEFLMPRAQGLDKREPVLTADGKPAADAAGHPLVAFKDKVLWPNDKSNSDRYDLVWAGSTNRYFGVAAYPIVSAGGAKTFGWVEKVSRVVLDGGQGNEVMAFRLESKPLALAPAYRPGAAADFTHGIYTGPLDRSEIGKDATLKDLGLTGLVVYNFGGPCSFCTFAPMADLLLWILHTLHDKVFQDWSMSIIFLVLIVRTCLHPVTKWSQIRMARFGKQMSGIAPKQKILQEKYKDDPKKLQEETGKLWREEGISPAGFLGCLPMVLQMPVWIALYASLYFSVEMRNEHAFYGIFQAVQPKTSPFWQFLGNLAEPDRLLYWGKAAINLPLIGSWAPHLPLLGDITALNVLPILLAVVFFIQQKYLTPPTAATLTPEQEFQQKMMRWMTVFMFPVFMYNAPSGLAIYFICNSTFAILESKYIRSHMAAIDAKKGTVQAAGVGTSIIDRKVKGPPRQKGFMERLQEMAEEKQKEARKRAGLPPGGVKRKK